MNAAVEHGRSDRQHLTSPTVCLQVVMACRTMALYATPPLWRCCARQARSSPTGCTTQIRTSQGVSTRMCLWTPLTVSSSCASGLQAWQGYLCTEDGISTTTTLCFAWATSRWDLSMGLVRCCVATCLTLCQLPRICCQLGVCEAGRLGRRRSEDPGVRSGLGRCKDAGAWVDCRARA